jgi:DNA modification methylase
METILNKIICADSLEFLKTIEPRSIDLIITDPPYGVLDVEWDQVEIKTFTKKWWDLAKKTLKRNSSAYIFFGQKHIPLGYKLFKPDRMLIWWHPNLAKTTSKMYLWMYDPIFFITKGNYYFNGEFCRGNNSDVFKYAKPQSNWVGDSKREHPTQKPLELIERLLSVSSQYNDMVLDPFLGAGTTALACAKMGRNFIGIEKDPGYVKIAERKLKEWESQGKLF